MTEYAPTGAPTTLSSSWSRYLGIFAASSLAASVPLAASAAPAAVEGISQRAPSATAGAMLIFGGEGLSYGAATNAMDMGTNVEVLKMRQAKPGIDLGAIAQVADLLARTFPDGDKPSPVTFEYDDDFGPMLSVVLNTHGMDAYDILNREIPMRELIGTDPRLDATSDYLNIVIW